MTRIRLVKQTFFASNRVMILVVIFAALLEHCLASSLGSKCQHDMDCTDFIKGSTCSMNGYCECAPYFVQYNVTTCLSSQLLGGDCILADQCTMKVANSSCLDGACRCVEGFLQFRKHTCLGPAHPGAVCYSHAHCQMNDQRSHCDFLIPNLFGRCQCTSPAKQYGGMCLTDDSSAEADAVLTQTTTYAPLITPPSTVFRPIDLISHYELSTQGKPLLVNNDVIDLPSSTENQVEFTKLPQLSVSSSSEQAGGEDLTTDSETLDLLSNYHITSSTEGLNVEVAQQAVTSDDYPYKIDTEDQTSANEEETEQAAENPHMPVAPAEEVVIPPQGEGNEVTNIEPDQKPEEEEQSENRPAIQSSSETVLVQEVEQELNEEDQQPEVEQQKPEEEIRPEEESVTEISADIEHTPENNPQNEAEVDAVVSETDKPEQNLDHTNEAEEGSGATSTADTSSHTLDKDEEHENIPPKPEYQDNIIQSGESASSPENSQENVISTEQENEEVVPTEKPAEDDNVQTSKPIESIVPELFSHEENLSGLSGEHLDEVNQESSEALNVESQEVKDDHTVQPIEANNDLEQDHPSDNEPVEVQTASEGGQMEESHYRPSSDVHGPEEATVVDEEVEPHIDMNQEMTPTISAEDQDTVLEEESEIGSSDINQSPNVEKEVESPETNNSNVNQEQTDFESHEKPALPEEHMKEHLEEAAQEENMKDQVSHNTSSDQLIKEEQVAQEAAQEETIQEQIPLETHSEQSIEEEQVAQEAAQEEIPQETHSEQSIEEQVAEEAAQEETIQEEIPQETHSEQLIEEEQVAQEAAQEEVIREQLPLDTNLEQLIAEAANEQNMQEQVPDETISEQSIDNENKDETHNAEENEEAWQSSEKQDEKNNEIENQPEPAMNGLPQIDEIKPSIQEENTLDQNNVIEDIKGNSSPEMIEEDHQPASEEEIKVNIVDQEENNLALSQSESEDQMQNYGDNTTAAQELGPQVAEEEHQEVPPEGPHKAIQETIEELLEEAVQALAEKDADELHIDQNNDEGQIITEKPLLESEEVALQTLQEEAAQQAIADELMSLPENQSEISEEKEEDTTPQISPEDSYVPPQQSESYAVPIDESVQQAIPEMITEAVEIELEEALPEKVNQMYSEEVQGQTDLATESVLQNEPLETLPTEQANEEKIIDKETIPVSLQNLLQGEPFEESQHNAQDSVSENEVPEIPSETQEEEHSTESIENPEPSKAEEHELESKLPASLSPQDISSDETISHENQLLASSEEIPIAPVDREEDIKETMLENESSNEALQQVHDLANIIDGAEPSNIANDNNPLNSAETLPSEILTSETNEGDETLPLDVNPISSDENTISESNEKTESDNALGTNPETKPNGGDEVKEIDTDAQKIEENEETLLENDQATTVRSESEQNSDHEPPVHTTFELEETQQVVENVNDNTPTDIEETNETQSGANANESEPAATEYVPLVTEESETLSTPVAAAAAAVEPEFSEIEKFEQFEDHHLFHEPLDVENDNQEAVVTTSRPLELESSPNIEENIENDLKVSGEPEFIENESVLSILSDLIEKEEEGSGTPLPESSFDDLKVEETVHSEQTPATGSYYPSVLSDLLMSTKSEDLANNKLTTLGPSSDNHEQEVAPEELPFDLSFVSPSDHEELMSDNLVVETTPSFFHQESSSENSITTEVPDILEITTQTMLGLASRVTLMEPSAPVATTLKPLMTSEEDSSTTSSTLNTDSLITSKPVRKRVELGNGPVSLGLNCNNDKQCQLADPNTICSDQGICDCVSKTAANCNAKRTGCSSGTFQCRSSGVCISWFFVCDGRPDCTDASDEECTFNARLNQTCPKESFRCEHSGRCISRAALCDGRKQCPHGEDEIECDSLRTVGGQCPPNTFRCNSGECLPEYEYCNAIISCKDGSDEPPHLCGSRSVPNIFLRLLTAAVVDDESAKSSSGGINAYCPHRCSNGRCRSTAIVCSGRDGCGDGTDEETCSVCRCPAPAYTSASAEFLAQQPPMPLWN